MGGFFSGILCETLVHILAYSNTQRLSPCINNEKPGNQCSSVLKQVSYASQWRLLPSQLTMADWAHDRIPQWPGPVHGAFNQASL